MIMMIGPSPRGLHDHHDDRSGLPVPVPSSLTCWGPGSGPCPPVMTHHNRRSSRPLAIIAKRFALAFSANQRDEKAYLPSRSASHSYRHLVFPCSSLFRCSVIFLSILQRAVAVPQHGLYVLGTQVGMLHSLISLCLYRAPRRVKDPDPDLS